jgi:hypothetical protein
VSRAVTEFLLGSGVLVPAATADVPAQWVTRLFPVWPEALSASFSGLVAKGGLVVSASYNASAVAVSSPVLITAPFAGPAEFVNATLRSPWPHVPQSAVTVTCGGSTVSVVWLVVPEGNETVPALSFLLPPGSSCAVQVSLQ